MKLFRKFFPLILFVCLGLMAMSYILPYITKANQPEIKIEPNEPSFSHEGNLSIFKKNGALISSLEIEFAQGEIETSLGLMYRKSMAQNRGMLFIFPEEQMRSFWMKNTYIALDIIYIDSKKQIVSISKNAMPLSEISRPSEAPAQYVLEVNAGVCDKLGLEAGDYITYETLMK